MPTIEEAANTFAKDLTSQNIAGLMLVFTPEGMMKAMTMQGQMQARAAQATNEGRAPAPATGYSLETKGPECDDQVVHITLESADGTAEIMTRWREIEGAWKVTDLALIGARNPGGTPVDLGGGLAPSPA
jgi:hypothetical protein